MDAAARGFQPYGLLHWTVLAITVLGAVGLVVFGRRTRGTEVEERFTHGFGVLQFVVTLTFFGLWLLPRFFSLGQSLPLQLSDLLRLVAGWALLRRSWWAFSLTYYWGLTFNPQALLTPDLHPDVAPVLELASYWIQHVLVMWAAVYLTWGVGMRPTWRSYRVAVAVTAGWAAVTVTINAALGTNYGYLNRKPSGGSLLDLLGVWPVYLFVVLAIVAVVWALVFTLPWTWRRRPALTP